MADDRSGRAVRCIDVDSVRRSAGGPIGWETLRTSSGALGWAVYNEIDVVNISLGGHDASTALQTAVTAAYNAGRFGAG